jgi:2-isopropylmalate synthase
VAAFVDALGAAGIAKVEVLQYAEHALGSGASATAIAYVCIKLPSSSICWGAGTDTSIERASIKAILSALNREFRRKL